LSLRDLASKGEGKKKSRNRRGRSLSSKESKSIRRRGYRAERQLVRSLRSLGFNAVRVPVSAPSSEPLPDVIAVKGNFLLAFEVKSPSADTAYFRKSQVEKLFKFLDMFEAYGQRLAVLAGKFPYKWVFEHVEEVDHYVLRKEENGNIKLSQIKG